jgi:hypothetical protein
VESGHIKIWSHSEGNVLITGNPVEKMRHSQFDSNIVATGGKENDLKLWDLEKSVCSFSAKNVSCNLS